MLNKNILTYRGNVVRTKNIADIYNLIYLENVVDSNGKMVTKNLIVKVEKNYKISVGDILFFYPTTIKKIVDGSKGFKIKPYKISKKNRKG